MTPAELESLAALIAERIAPRQWLDTPQAADYLGVSTQFLEISRSKCGGPEFYKCGRLVRYRRADLDSYIVGSQAVRS